MFRVNQFSKDLGVKPKEMQKYLKDAGIGEMSPSATLDDEDAGLLLAFLTEGKQIKDLDIDDNAFKGIEAIINSMTPKERENPGLMNGSRKNRIAAGAGVSLVEVNRFLKQFEQMGKMMRKVQVMQQSGKRFRR